MKIGTYKNKAGAILVVTGVFKGAGRIRTIGGIYLAEAQHPMFGPEAYLVTQQSMDAAGYEPVDENGESNG